MRRRKTERPSLKIRVSHEVGRLSGQYVADTFDGCFPLLNAACGHRLKSVVQRAKPRQPSRFRSEGDKSCHPGTPRSTPASRPSSRPTAKTIASQVAALQARVRRMVWLWRLTPLLDEGYSGATLVRPALEQLRDPVAAGGMDRLYVHSPDRLARRMPTRCCCWTNSSDGRGRGRVPQSGLGRSPEDDLLLQVQGMVAEYERAKILERSRRGKRHGAQAGVVSVLSGAPYGYRYIGKEEGGGAARYEIVLEEARVVRQVFHWVGQERRHHRRGLPPPDRGRRAHPHRQDGLGSDHRVGHAEEPGLCGAAAFGKTRAGRCRPACAPSAGGASAAASGGLDDRRPGGGVAGDPGPAAGRCRACSRPSRTQLAENRQHARQRQRGARYLLQGCWSVPQCGYAFYGKPVSRGPAQARRAPMPTTAAWAPTPTASAASGSAPTPRCGPIAWMPPSGRRCAACWRSRSGSSRSIERRLATRRAPGGAICAALEAQRSKLRQGLARLIDSYAEGLIDKEEFEPRIARLRQRSQLEEQAVVLQDEAEQRAALSLIVGRLEDFARQVCERVASVDWRPAAGPNPYAGQAR